MRRGIARVQPTVIPAPSWETRDALVLEHLPLARAIAVRVYENLPVHVDLDDLVHAGVMGLFDAALKFDAGKQIGFKTYAKHRIKGSILDSLRGLDWASRDLRRRHKQLEEITRQFVATQERTPTEAEVAEQTLPKTASPLPLIGLFGLLALGGAFTLRAVASRVR